MTRFGASRSARRPRFLGGDVLVEGGRWLVVLLCTLGVLACQSSGDKSSDEDAPPVVDVTAVDYAFQAPDSIPSGWVTFRMTNEGEEHHVFVLISPPSGITYSDYRNQIYAPYDSLQSLRQEGVIDSTAFGEELRRVIPDWYPDQIELMGGVGLTAPGRTGRTTLNLEPGIYVMECYAKTPERRFHALRGMIRPLVVTNDSSGASGPAADLTVTASKLQIQVDSTVYPGSHTIAVQFAEKPEGGSRLVQHTHLARLDQDTGVEQLAQWMAFDPVLPAPVEFLGGAQDMPAGHTAYVQVDLVPGRYAWVLGTPPERGMVQPFTVKDTAGG